jgi:hypothetical protein
MKKIIGIFWVLVSVFLAYRTINQYIADKDIYRLFFSIETENRLTYLIVWLTISGLVLLNGISRLKQAYDSKS